MESHSYSELADVFLAHEDELNAIHISAMFTAATRIRPTPTQPSDGPNLIRAQRCVEEERAHLLTQLVNTAADRLHMFAPRQLANVLYSVAKLRLVVSPQWLLHWERHAMPQLNQFDQQALSNALWAFATMSCRPSEAFVQQLLGRCHWLVVGMSPQHCGNLLWAMAQLQIQAPDALVSAFAHRVLKLEPRMTPRDYAHVLHGLSYHPRPLPASWLDAVALASAKKLTRGSPEVRPVDPPALLATRTPALASWPRSIVAATQAV
jgi:hypothetical protein